MHQCKSPARENLKKTELIRILWQRLTEIGIENEQSVSDTDVLTVKKALEMAKHHQTTVLSDNRDILVLIPLRHTIGAPQ